MAKKKAAKAAPKKRASKARTPPCPQYPEWSTAKYWSFIRSGLRSTYNRWPAKWTVLAAAKREYTGEGKQQKWEFQCAECGGWFKQKDVSVDHKIPAGALNCYEDIAGFVERLFVSPDGLQVLCKEHHDRKTKEERGSK